MNLRFPDGHENHEPDKTMVLSGFLFLEENDGFIKR